MVPEVLCPLLAVYGSLPRPARTVNSATQIQRAKTQQEDMMEVQREHSRRIFSFGLKHNSGKKGVESSNKLRNIPSGAPILVYQEALNE